MKADMLYIDYLAYKRELEQFHDSARPVLDLIKGLKNNILDKHNRSMVYHSLSIGTVSEMLLEALAIEKDSTDNVEDGRESFEEFLNTKPHTFGVFAFIFNQISQSDEKVFENRSSVRTSQSYVKLFSALKSLAAATMRDVVKSEVDPDVNFNIDFSAISSEREFQLLRIMVDSFEDNPQINQTKGYKFAKVVREAFRNIDVKDLDRYILSIEYDGCTFTRFGEMFSYVWNQIGIDEYVLNDVDEVVERKDDSFTEEFLDMEEDLQVEDLTETELTETKQRQPKSYYYRMTYDKFEGTAEGNRQKLFSRCGDYGKQMSIFYYGVTSIAESYARLAYEFPEETDIGEVGREISHIDLMVTREAMEFYKWKGSVQEFISQPASAGTELILKNCSTRNAITKIDAVMYLEGLFDDVVNLRKKFQNKHGRRMSDADHMFNWEMIKPNIGERNGQKK